MIELLKNVLFIPCSVFIKLRLFKLRVQLCIDLDVLRAGEVAFMQDTNYAANQVDMVKLGKMHSRVSGIIGIETIGLVFLDEGFVVDHERADIAGLQFLRVRKAIHKDCACRESAAACRDRFPIPSSVWTGTAARCAGVPPRG